jgi:hypothetical protein
MLECAAYSTPNKIFHTQTRTPFAFEDLYALQRCSALLCQYSDNDFVEALTLQRPQLWSKSDKKLKLSLEYLSF